MYMVVTMNQVPLDTGKEGRDVMAKNTGEGFRRGAVTERTQVHNPKTNLWVKRDTDNGQFMDNKTSGAPFKGVRKER